jgi:HEAT repeat protein
LKIACQTLLVLVLLSSIELVKAQDSTSQTPSAPPETAAIAQGWALLAQGNAAKASALSAELISQFPRSAAVLVLAVDTDIARAGAMAGLDTYERWLGRKTTDDGYVLRRVGHALLRELARDPKDRAARVEALEALIADGDAGSAVGLDPDVSKGGIPEAAVLASIGNEQAVKSLIAELNSPMGNRRVALAGLARSQSPLAVKPLVGLLADPDPYLRGAAADALAKLGATQAIPSIKPLLNDPVFSVHLNAAGALLALKDTSGLAWLQQLETSEHPGVRLAAAQASKSEPHAGWLTLVRTLTKDEDPLIRWQAADLIAPHDPETARATLARLLEDTNPAVREAAGRSFVQVATSDFAELRRFLRNAESGMRVRAAARILELTR